MDAGIRVASYGWCWYPGAIHSRHYWSPGLVAFVGFGGGGGIGFNNIGWVPLAPHERYNRWYGRGFYGGNRGFGNVNVVNVNIYNTYRNARVPNGVSAIDGARFGRGGSGEHGARRMATCSGEAWCAVNCR